MSRTGLRRFLETAANDRGLSRQFAEAVARIARDSGFDVTADDAGRLLQEMARQHGRVPGDRPEVTTLAMGEEDARSVTLAIGEEDSQRGPIGSTEAVGEEDKTTKAMGVGEEDNRRQPDATTLAVGEEDRRRGPVGSTEAVGEEDRAVTMAIPEEGPRRPDATTLAVGEEDKNKPPRRIKDPSVITDAIGEDDNGPIATTEAVGEEDRAVTMAIPEEGPRRPEPRMTTKAVGEEDDDNPYKYTEAVGEENWGRNGPPDYDDMSNMTDAEPEFEEEGNRKGREGGDIPLTTFGPEGEEDDKGRMRRGPSTEAVGEEDDNRPKNPPRKPKGPTPK